jgi:hypothetical protein
MESDNAACIRAGPRAPARVLLYSTCVAVLSCCSVLEGESNGMRGSVNRMGRGSGSRGKSFRVTIELAGGNRGGRIGLDHITECGIG